jgi:hypothetical protein
MAASMLACGYQPAIISGVMAAAAKAAAKIMKWLKTAKRNESEKSALLARVTQHARRAQSRGGAEKMKDENRKSVMAIGVNIGGENQQKATAAK